MIERDIKKKIKQLLDSYEGKVYYFMPVQVGYGATTLDYLGFVCGLGFAIEAKRPGAKPTVRQGFVIENIQQSQTPVFLVNDDASLNNLRLWLDWVINGVTVGGLSGSTARNTGSRTRDFNTFVPAAPKRHLPGAER